MKYNQITNATTMYDITLIKSDENGIIHGLQ